MLDYFKDAVDYVRHGFDWPELPAFPKINLEKVTRNLPIYVGLVGVSFIAGVMVGRDSSIPEPFYDVTTMPNTIPNPFINQSPYRGPNVNPLRPEIHLTPFLPLVPDNRGNAVPMPYFRTAPYTSEKPVTKPYGSMEDLIRSIDGSSSIQI
jgi:hypothetical protein